MKYRIKTEHEVSRLQCPFEDKVQNFVDDVRNNYGLVVDVKKRAGAYIINHQQLKGSGSDRDKWYIGSGSDRDKWHIGRDTLRDYFVEVEDKPINLFDEKLFEV